MKMMSMDLMTNSSALHFLICCFDLHNFTKFILLEVAIDFIVSKQKKKKNRRLVSLMVSDRDFTYHFSCQDVQAGPYDG